MVQDRNNSQGFDIRAFIADQGGGAVLKYYPRQIVYRQGDRADALFYIVSGTVKVTVNSEYGKEAVIALLGAGDFFGEGCVNGHSERRVTITTTGVCELARIEQATVKRALDADPAFAKLLLKYLVERNEKLKADLIDQFFNSSEKRLARVLLTLAKSADAEQPSVITLPINQELLASMVGTTRSRINQFMNKFRKKRFIEYNGHENNSQIKVYHSLLSVILDDQPQDDEA